MINRDNWKNVKAYLEYRRDVERISESSQRLEESWLRQLLQWADDCSFEKVSSIRPVFSEYLSQRSLSLIYKTHVIRSAYRFFFWLVKHRKGFLSITPAWLDTLRISRGFAEYKEHEIVTIEEVRAIAHAPVETIRERRIRASAVFWFLSGIRVGAFVTLSLNVVDLDSLTVKQWPELGVKTKFNKHATTFLLDIPDLLEVVRDWDKEVRAVFPHSLGAYWFTPVDPETGQFTFYHVAGVHRASIARRDLRDWLRKVGLPYHSPHKFRHGHAVYALKNAKDVSALKAVSQNLMHKNLAVTDGVYAVLSDLDVQERISSLGKDIQGVQDMGQFVALLRQLLERIEIV